MCKRLRNKRGNCRFAIDLFKEAFNRNSSYKKEMDALERSLTIKTLILHLSTMIGRVAFSSVGQSYWQKAFANREQYEDLDQEFVEKSMPIVKTMIIAMIPIGVLLNLSAWYWRSLAQYIIYYEVLSMIFQTLVPFDYGEFELLVILQTYFQIYFTSVVKTGQSIVVCVIGMIISKFIAIPLTYNIEGGAFSMNRLVTLLVMVFIIFVFTAVLSMLLTYVVRIRGRMGYLIIENVNLLSKMHEGLIVIDDNDDRTLKIVNQPAINILKQNQTALNQQKQHSISNDDEDKESKFEIGVENLNMPLFKPTTMSLNRVMQQQSAKTSLESSTMRNSSKDQQKQSFNEEKVISLEQIIKNQLSSQNSKSDFKETQNLSDRPIYEIQNQAQKSMKTNNESSYTQVRVKKIDYLETPSIAVYFQNMTTEVEQLRLESKLLEEINKNASLQSYTSTISHEFRTPIGTALMFLEQMVQTNKFSPAVTKTLNLIISQLNFLLCLVNDILALKQIESEQFQCINEIYNPVKLLDFVVDIFRPQSEMSNVPLTYEIVSPQSANEALNYGFNADILQSAVLPEKLVGDPTRLKQILINLVKNAFKFTRRGSIRIITAFDAYKEMLHVNVVDTGKGITTDEKEQLFLMFGKLLRTAEMNSEGIGMGLMICQNLVIKNKGEITVHSDGQDKGAIFSFTFESKLQGKSASKPLTESSLIQISSQLRNQQSNNEQLRQQRRIINKRQDNVIETPKSNTQTLLITTSETKQSNKQLEQNQPAQCSPLQQNWQQDTTRAMIDNSALEGLIQSENNVNSSNQQADQHQRVKENGDFEMQNISVVNRRDQEGQAAPKIGHLIPVSDNAQQLNVEGTEGIHDAVIVPNSEQPSCTVAESQIPSVIMKEDHQDSDLDDKDEKQFSFGNEDEDNLLIMDDKADLSKILQQKDDQKLFADLDSFTKQHDSQDKVILLVEDNQFNSVAIQSLFAQFDFICDICYNGFEAIEMIKRRLESNQRMYKLILMDFSMPDCDGTQATRAIRQHIAAQNSGIQQPVICCLTAYMEKQYKIAAKEAGMDLLFVKPIFKTQAQKILAKAELL